jgi:hypothetical protein
MTLTADLVALATQYSVPPPIVYALDVTAGANPENVRLLSQQFAQTHSWEASLTQVMGGNPQAPTPDIAGQVHATLGIAASRPDWGMQGWKPLDMTLLAHGAKAMEKTARGLARLGGVVTPEHVDSWGMTVTRVKQPQAAGGPVQWPSRRSPQAAQKTDLHNAREIGEFGQQLKQMGVTPAHFMQLFPTVATLHRRLRNSKFVSLDDFAPHAGQTPDMVLQSVRDLPHPLYPEHTTGQMHDAYQTAQQYSLPHAKRSPTDLESARFVAAQMSHKDIEHYYATRYQSDQPVSSEIEGSKKKNADLKVVGGGRE